MYLYGNKIIEYSRKYNKDNMYYVLSLSQLLFKALHVFGHFILTMPCIIIIILMEANKIA